MLQGAFAARALICGWWPINVLSMAGFRKTGLLAANAFVATACGAMKYFCDFFDWRFFSG
jgi:hypothetical protein